MRYWDAATPAQRFPLIKVDQKLNAWPVPCELAVFKLRSADRLPYALAYMDIVNPRKISRNI